MSPNTPTQSTMATKPKKAAAKKPALKQIYGKPEKRNMMPLILGWGFIAIAGGIIIWMIAVNPPQKKLSCTSPPGGNSLIGFGTCTEE